MHFGEGYAWVTKEGGSAAGYKGEDEIVWFGFLEKVDDFLGAGDASLVWEGVASGEYFGLWDGEVVWFVVGDDYTFLYGKCVGGGLCHAYACFAKADEIDVVIRIEW